MPLPQPSPAEAGGTVHADSSRPLRSEFLRRGVWLAILLLIVVVVGGLGSLKGSLVGSLIIGQAETFGKAWLPEAAMLIIYVVMAAIMLVRPQGLFGRPLK